MSYAEYEIVGSQLSVSADTAAVLEPGLVSWNHEQLQHQLDRLSNQLASFGIGRDDTVAVAIPDGAACLLSQLAVLKVCACAPLNAQLTPAELKRDLIELGVKALLCSADSDQSLALAEELGLISILVSLKGAELIWQPRIPRSLNSPATAKPNCGAALLLHTSATTGRRKIVPLTRGNLRSACVNTSQSLHLTSRDRLLVMARLFHAQGILSALSQLSVGGTVVVSESLDPAVLTRQISNLLPTWYTCGPTLHQALLAELRKHPTPLQHGLRLIRSGGNTLPPEVKEALQQHLRVPVLDMYGLSETGAVAAASLDPAHPDGWRSVGPEISILSPEGQPVAPGEEGEIAVRGPSVLAGYWNDDDANREAFWPGQWFRTGDLGRLDSHGILTLSGRLKEIINRGGQKILPAEVDQVLRQHPGVKAVATFAISHPTLGEDVASAVVLQEGAAVTEPELQAFARTSLVRYKVPRRIHFVPALPLGATGKPQRLVLRERYGTHPAAHATAAAAASNHKPSRTERTIAEFWATQLACNEIRPHDDYFQAGGDSLGAISMLAEVEALLDLPLPPGATERFFESPTVQTLAHLLAAPGMAHAQLVPKGHDLRIYPLLGDGPGLEAFLIPADDEEGWYYRLLSRHLGKFRPLWMLRPANGLYAPGPRLIERAARRAVELIRNNRPHGPYLIGGFCLGGVIAYETARLLEQAGEPVALILFNTSVPGQPHLLKAWKQYLRQWLVLLRSRNRRRFLVYPIHLLRRLLWLALRRLRQHTPLRLGWISGYAEHNYFPLYRAASSNLPILHFIVGEGQEPLVRASVLSWRQITAAETRVVPLAGSHDSLFREANLPLISQTIEEWAGVWIKSTNRQRAALY